MSRRYTLREVTDRAVGHICHRYPVDRDDLAQEAAVAVLEAARRADAHKGDPTHYASVALRRHLYRVARRTLSPVTLPKGREHEVRHYMVAPIEDALEHDGSHVAPQEAAMYRAERIDAVRRAVRAAAREEGVPMVGEWMLRTGGPVPVSQLALGSGRSRAWWSWKASCVRKRVREMLRGDTIGA